MTRKLSAAQKAAGYFGQNFSSVNAWWYKPEICKELAAALLREDRERRQMERAIVAWCEAPTIFLSKRDSYRRQTADDALYKIARRLARQSAK